MSTRGEVVEREEIKRRGVDIEEERRERGHLLPSLASFLNLRALSKVPSFSKGGALIFCHSTRTTGASSTNLAL